MGASGGETAVDEVDIGTAWEGLVSKPRSQLVDVRTRAEWTYVGIPDLGPLGNKTIKSASLLDAIIPVLMCAASAESLVAATIACMGVRPR